MSGIFGTLSEIVDEVGDTLQVLITALQATNVWDEDVTTHEYTYYRSGKKKGMLKEHVIRVRHWKVNLLEVTIALLAAGIITFTRNEAGKLGVQLKKAIPTGALGLAGSAGAAVDPENPFWWMTPWGTAAEGIHQLTGWPMKKGQ